MNPKGERVLVTGINGFVGQHVSRYLTQSGYEVWGIGRSAVSVPLENCHYLQCDLLNDELDDWLRDHRPQYLIHLAAENDISASWRDPVHTLESNSLATAKLLQAIKRSKVDFKKIVLAGSAYEYDTEQKLPITEESPLHPQSPYAWSKYLQSSIGQMYGELYGFPIIVARMFNLIGPGARGGVLPQLVKEIVQLEKGKREDPIGVGQLNVERDFLDVRDAVAALSQLLSVPGSSFEVFNICTGKPLSIQNLVDHLRKHTTSNFEVSIDPSLNRPNDPLKVYGNNDKLKNRLNWKPEFTLDTTISDLFSEFRKDEKKGEE